MHAFAEFYLYGAAGGAITAAVTLIATRHDLNEPKPPAWAVILAYAVAWPAIVAFVYCVAMYQIFKVLVFVARKI